jgi:hypothetical protein
MVVKMKAKYDFFGVTVPKYMASILADNHGLPPPLALFIILL